MKITIYELLGLIKDGKAPKKILLNGIVFEYQGDDYLYKDEDKKEHWLFSVSYTDKYMWLENFLKAEVEIIEEPKEDKIQKIYHCETSLTQNEVEIFITENLNQMVDKINELIDEINNLKEKKEEQEK